MACSEPTSVATIQLSVLSDKPVYYLTGDTAAQPILINRSSVPVYLPLTDYVAVQWLEDGRWSEPYGWFSAGYLNMPNLSFAIRAGDTLCVFPMEFRFVNHAPGVYRFIFVVSRDSSSSESLPESMRVSPAFEIRQ